ncbi:hypothetical protein [Serratia proteamaculans]|jgi:hypothetical protein|uniref:hypothetical protein n=1 Tax=Serratia proteamaculans TaxID=28151 RepID=UPI00217BC126|nr:hypothetical protein [Serratia proteamaculans]CAI1720361.1 Uncharacterised protein [Serratia proteamaculans]CAI2440624.1 Uncharacterised protein [Serratia proteamaculans]
MAVQHKIMAASKRARPSVDQPVSVHSENDRVSAASMGYIGRPREAEIPDLEVSFESLDSLLEREKQLKN